MTAEGSAPSGPRWKAAPLRSAQTWSCSAAAALKVSAATRSTERPSDRHSSATFPIVVVLPTPFTPTTNTTHGRAPKGTTDGGWSTWRRISSRSRSIIAATPPAAISPLRALSASTASAAAATPMSAAMRDSSTASRSAASRGRLPRTRSSTGMFITARVRDRPAFSRSTRLGIGGWREAP